MRTSIESFSLCGSSCAGGGTFHNLAVRSSLPVTTIMEQRDPITIFGILKHSKDVFGSGVGEFHELAQSIASCPLEGLANLPSLLRQVPQIVYRVVTIVCECLKDHRLADFLGHDSVSAVTAVYDKSGSSSMSRAFRSRTPVPYILLLRYR